MTPAPALALRRLDPERRTHHAPLDDLDRQRERAPLHQRGEVLRVLPGKAAGDLRPAGHTRHCYALGDLGS